MDSTSTVVVSVDTLAFAASVDEETPPVFDQSVWPWVKATVGIGAIVVGGALVGTQSEEFGEAANDVASGLAQTATSASGTSVIADTVIAGQVYVIELPAPGQTSGELVDDGPVMVSRGVDGRLQVVRGDLPG